MKRSEFITRYQSDTWITGAALRAAEMAEAGGVVWDPEEKSLPERLEIYAPAAGPEVAYQVDPPRHWILTRASGSEDPLVEIYRQRVFSEAVRRWNAWALIRQEVEALIGWYSNENSYAHLGAQRLLAILDGKEGK